MKIISMTATFGCLNATRLEPGEGLTLIQAPNEGGKSTWCAFWRSMLYGIDTKDRDKKGYLADKNRYQPWGGAPMEGELRLVWQDRDITIRRWQKGNVPFGAFSAVYTGTQEPVPGLTGDSCGQLLTGVGREVFERSAFIGAGGNLSVTAAPELERRIAALVSSGEEEVSYSQTEGKLREWLNRRRVNKSVGLLPKLEEQLRQVRQGQDELTQVCTQIAALEGERHALAQEKNLLEGEQSIHQRLERRAINQRYAQAGEELNSARVQLSALEGESAKYGPLPDKELLKKAQGELQYLKVLDEEIKSGQDALKQAEETYVQAQRDCQDEHFSGMTADEAAAQVDKQLREYAMCHNTAQAKATGAKLFLALGLLCVPLAALWSFIQEGTLLASPLYGGLAMLVLCGLISLVNRSNAKQWHQRGDKLLQRYAVQTPEQLTALAADYRRRCAQAQDEAGQLKAIRGTLNDRMARRDNSRSDLLQFVHTFAPQVSDLFGCSAALSRALNLDYELAMARQRVEERRLRREDLAAQGGQDFDTLELLLPPQRTPQQTAQELTAVSARLEQVTLQLHQALGRQKAMGDPAALAAHKEQLEEQVARRELEHQALTLALDALQQANTRLQERFSPQLNRLAGQYMARLTGDKYQTVTLNRELEGAAGRTEDVLPHSQLYLSRGTADQLYLAVRLAVGDLCLPQQPPLVLDDALAAFDETRLALALELLQELGQQRQVLLFTCHSREGTALASCPQVTRLGL